MFVLQARSPENGVSGRRNLSRRSLKEPSTRADKRNMEPALSASRPEPHPVARAVRDAAAKLLAHEHTPPRALWRRWVEHPRERHLLDDVRAFVMALDDVLNAPPHAVSGADVAAVGEQIERVISRIEASLDHPGPDQGPLATAIYVIRARYEEIYRRGASVHRIS